MTDDMRSMAPTQTASASGSSPYAHTNGFESSYPTDLERDVERDSYKFDGYAPQAEGVDDADPEESLKEGLLNGRTLSRRGSRTSIRTSLAYPP